MKVEFKTDKITFIMNLYRFSVQIRLVLIETFMLFTPTTVRSFGKFSAQVGVRVEQYNLDARFERNERNPDYYEATNVEDDIFTAYPSAYLSYKLDDSNTFNVNYTRRVTDQVSDKLIRLENGQRLC